MCDAARCPRSDGCHRRRRRRSLGVYHHCMSSSSSVSVSVPARCHRDRREIAFSLPRISDAVTVAANLASHLTYPTVSQSQSQWHCCSGPLAFAHNREGHVATSHNTARCISPRSQFKRQRAQLQCHMVLDVDILYAAVHVLFS